MSPPLVCVNARRKPAKPIQIQRTRQQQETLSNQKLFTEQGLLNR